MVTFNVFSYSARYIYDLSFKTLYPGVRFNTHRVMDHQHITCDMHRCGTQIFSLHFNFIHLFLFINFTRAKDPLQVN